MVDIAAQKAADFFYQRGRWRALARQVGLIASALAPILLINNSQATPYIALASAVWAVVELLVLRRGERKATTDGARCQEIYDIEYLQLVPNPVLVDPMTAERVAHAASKSKLSVTGPWYGSGAVTPEERHSCQAENARWSSTLQKRYALLLTFSAAVVVCIGIVLALAQNLSLRNYLLRIAIPTIPGLMSVANLIDAHLRSADAWNRVDAKLAEVSAPDGERLRRQQDLIYLARASFPLIPKLFYSANRWSLNP